MFYLLTVILKMELELIFPASDHIVVKQTCEKMFLLFAC